MIIIGERAYLKSYDKKMNQDVNLQNEVGKLVTVKNEDIKNNKVKRKEGKNANNDIYKNIKNKASILNGDHRHIQDQISFIQVQEQKVDEMENTLKQSKLTYQRAMDDGKQEEARQKIKVKKVIKNIKNSNNGQTQKEEYVTGDKNILSVLEEYLIKINDIKVKLSSYKSKLIRLETEVQNNKKKIESTEKAVEEFIRRGELITEKINLGAFDFISIEGTIDTGIIINIQV